MNEYLQNTIPNLKPFNYERHHDSHFINQQWVLVNGISKKKSVYTFKEDNILEISNKYNPAYNWGVEISGIATICDLTLPVNSLDTEQHGWKWGDLLHQNGVLMTYFDSDGNDRLLHVQSWIYVAVTTACPSGKCLVRLQYRLHGESGL